MTMREGVYYNFIAYKSGLGNSIVKLEKKEAHYEYCGGILSLFDASGSLAYSSSSSCTSS